MAELWRISRHADVTDRPSTLSSARPFVPCGASRGHLSQSGNGKDFPLSSAMHFCCLIGLLRCA